MRSSRREVVIELTSLLDVVMIIIFAVLIENSKMTKDSQQGLVEAQAQIEQMQSDMDTLSEKLSSAEGMLAEGDTAELLEKLEYAQSVSESYSYLENVVAVISVNLENKYNNTKRCLTYGQGINDKAYRTPDIARNDEEGWQVAVNQFKLYLNDTITDIIEEDSSKADIDKRRIYITFSADYDHVYNSDYEDIVNAIQVQIDKDKTGIVQLKRISLGDKEGNRNAK